jgi:DNA-binding response OmpR family regulator
MIHQHPRFEHMPIVFVSGIYVDEVDRLKGYQYGAVDYVPVPVTPEVLRAKVKVFTELHRQQRQLELLNERITVVQEEERRRIAR